MATPATSHNRRTHHVRTDLVVGVALITITMLGRLLSQAAGSGWFDIFGTR